MIKFSSFLLTLLLVTAVGNLASAALSNEKQQKIFTEYMDKITDLDREMDKLTEGADVMTKKLAESAYAQYMLTFALLEELSQAPIEEELRARLAGKLLGESSRNLFRFMRHYRDEHNPDGRVSQLTKVRRMFGEMAHDIWLFFYFPKAADGSRTWGPIEAKARVDFLKKMIPLYHEKMDKLAPLVSDDTDGLKMEEYFWGQYHYTVDRALNIRLERDSAQYWTRMFYFFLGLVLFAQPPVAYTTAEYLSYWDAFNSGVINMAVLWTMYTIKGMTADLDTTKQWVALHDDLMTRKSEDFTEMLRGKLKQHFPKEYFKPLIPKTLRFEIRAREKIKQISKKTWKNISNLCERGLTAR